MRVNFLIYILAFCFVQTKLLSQNLDFDFLKSALTNTDVEFSDYLKKKNFNLIAQEYKNSSDKLINKSDYYSNKSIDDQSLEGGTETALFVNKKRNKKSILISFSQNLSFENFNNLENEIKQHLKKEGAFQSSKYESTILKYSLDATLFYLFKEEDTYYIILSNYPLEEAYFNK